MIFFVSRLGTSNVKGQIAAVASVRRWTMRSVWLVRHNESKAGGGGVCFKFFGHGQKRWRLRTPVTGLNWISGWIEVQLYRFLTSALEGVGGQHHATTALPPGKTRYPLYRRLGGPKGRSGQVRKISPPPGFCFQFTRYLLCQYQYI
jgi:hypothetical protein